MHRRLAEGRKTAQGALANRVLGMGDVFQVEKVSIRAFQRAFGRSVGRRAPGMFVERLSRKAESAGGKVIAFPTKTTALSQVCQCGRRAKKPLSLRWHECPCGVSAQRDLYSAHLARFVYQTEDKR
jgi:putative transposase